MTNMSMSTSRILRSSSTNSINSINSIGSTSSTGSNASNSHVLDGSRYNDGLHNLKDTIECSSKTQCTYTTILQKMLTTKKINEK
jgi:hypothetical protein